MFKTILRRPVVSGNNVLSGRRNFSLISIHSKFPATLYRFQLHRESQLYDEKLQKEEDEVDDAVKISKDGLVYPEVSDEMSNGARFMPNTFFMQELTRMSHDYCLENLAESQPSAYPHYLCIPKGTPIPSTLALLRERGISSRFQLLPSSPMPLDELNNTLTEFYSKCGTTTPAEEWLGEHDYGKAFEDSKEDWMRH
ncbi:hypothetical protein FQN49_008159 [Arthroderma sp. PD_2]|nr:hypothetical protein FQN49_008159 [Arthroderma sp. PD_2]